MKLTLGQAAKHAGRAKGTLSKALTNGHISAEKDDKGRWQIDPSELQRWMDSNPFQNNTETGVKPPLETPRNPSENSALSVEVKMLREQIERSDSDRERDRDDREREREKHHDEVEALRTLLERQSAEHRQALAVLTDQRERAADTPRRGFWARLMG